MTDRDAKLAELLGLYDFITGDPFSFTTPSGFALLVPAMAKRGWRLCLFDAKSSDHTSGEAMFTLYPRVGETHIHQFDYTDITTLFDAAADAALEALSDDD